MKRKDNFFENLFILYLILEPLNQALRLLIGYWAQFIFPILYLILILINRKRIIEIKPFLFFVVFFVFSLCYSLIGYRDHLYNFFGLAYLLLGVSLPWLLVGLNAGNTKILFDKINKKLPYILLTNLILIFVCWKLKGSLVGNMEISYSILPLAIFSLYYFLESKRFLNLLFFLIALFIIISFGSRGPLLCIASFIFIYLLMNFKKHKWLFGAAAVLSIFLVFNFEPILHTSIDFLASHGIESRTLYKVKNGDISDDTGRSKIYDVVRNLIEDNGLVGVGLGVERITINEELHEMNKEMSSCYPHNLFLEIIVQYGWFIGGAICISIVLLILKSIFVAKKEDKYVILILASIEFVRLMISSSYVVSVLLFYLIGFCIRTLRERSTKDEKSLNSGAI